MPTSEITRQLDEAGRYLAARKYLEAHAACLAVLKEAPETAQAYYLLGVLAADHNNHAKACELFGRAIALEPAQGRYLAERGRSRVALFDRKGALDDARLAAAQETPSARTLDTIGVIYSRLGLHGDAAPYFQRAAAANPDNASFAYNLGSALQFLGDFEGAERAFRRVITLDPANARAWSSLVLMQKQAPGGEDVARLEALFAGLSGADDRLHVGHALAKIYEDLGEAKRAMTWLAEAKALKRASVAHDVESLGKLFAASAATASQEVQCLEASPASPIFIVGLPRTGTTLLDRILSSHSDVTSAGELSDFALELKRATATPSPLVLDAETLNAASQVDLGPVGRRYIERARNVVGDAPRFLDKMPLNFFYAPLVLAALPNARVICLRRNPADTVLSNYRQLFSTSFGYYQYAYDLTWTADYYARFDALISTFRRRLPQHRFTEVWYEDMVRDLLGQARRIVSFCGLDWQDQCLAFHENAAPVATASASQVRRPLYASSVNRWRRYRESMAPALATLSERGITFE